MGYRLKLRLVSIIEDSIFEYDFRYQ